MGDRMKKTRRIAALFLAALALAALLAGCGGSKCVLCGKTIRGSGYQTSAGYVCQDCYNSLSSGGAVAPVRGGMSTGAWIAVVLMVFVAVFAATSGIVYLVLQRVLPPEEPVSRLVQTPDSQPRAPRTAPPRPAASPAPRSGDTGSGVWICPRDGSRNTSRYCSVCGASRPASSAPRQGNPSAPRQGNPSAQRPAAPRQENRPASGNGAGSSPRYAAPAGQTARGDGAEPAAPRQASPAPVSPEAEEPKAYRPRYARPAQEQQPQRKEPEIDPEIDSEWLSAIFREAARDTDSEE